MLVIVNRVLDKGEKLPVSFRDHINLEEMLAKKRKRRAETQNATSRGSSASYLREA